MPGVARECHPHRHRPCNLPGGAAIYHYWLDQLGVAAAHICPGDDRCPVHHGFHDDCGACDLYLDYLGGHVNHSRAVDDEQRAAYHAAVARCSVH